MKENPSSCAVNPFPHLLSNENRKPLINPYWTKIFMRLTIGVILWYLNAPGEEGKPELEIRAGRFGQRTSSCSEASLADSLSRLFPLRKCWHGTVHPLCFPSGYRFGCACVCLKKIRMAACTWKHFSACAHHVSGAALPHSISPRSRR